MIGFGPAQEYPLGRPFGIPLGIQIWLAYLLAAVVGFSVLSRRPLDGTWIVVLFASILLHEFGHALAARRAGDHVLRVTLHLLGGVTVRAGRTTASQDLRITALGPLVNVVLAGAAFAAWRAAGPSLPHWAAVVLYQALWSNVLLGAFNILPIHPLDGGTMARLLLQHRLGRGAAERLSLGLSIATLVVAAVWLIAAGWIGLLAVVLLAQLVALNVMEMRRVGPPSLAEVRGILAERGRRRERKRADRSREDRDERVLRDGPRLLDRALERGLGSLVPEERRLLMLHRRLIEIRVDSAPDAPDPRDLRLLEKHAMLGGSDLPH